MTSSKSPKEKKQFWVRILCIAVAVLMVGSVILAALLGQG